ncbi:DUF945 family protein [Halomonas halocynthiae]|uniref:DUF945 family protein n=1 Tax=Halomonas halocynthiae TaxID=176290 RepID=UPI0003FFCB3B|nr:DUF945 family protein [Halomonas halocynthiae]
MRMERLVVPLLSLLALIWAVAQTMAGVFFERELTRAIADLQARGELLIYRSEVDNGWLASRGVLHVSPLLDNGWHIDIPYRARHGIFDTYLDGTLQPHPDEGKAVVSGGQSLHWKARYHMLAGTFDGALELPPIELRQHGSRLEMKGGRVAFRGGFGDWQVRARLEAVRLMDGKRRFEGGPFVLESRYAYTQGAHHFSQHDHLRLSNLRWIQPDLTLAAGEVTLSSMTTLDESELRVHSELDLGQIYAAGEVLLAGSVSAELSRLKADALRALFHQLRHQTTTRQGASAQELADNLRWLMKDSPRLDILDVNIDSPMLGASLTGSGVMVFDTEGLEELDPLALSTNAERTRWWNQVDGDFLWRNSPPMAALWLGLPLGTQELQFDVVSGQLRVNGRPLPDVLHWR